jgi:hypothetical protein
MLISTNQVLPEKRFDQNGREKKREENGNHGVDFATSVFVPATVLGRVDRIPADLEVAIALKVLKVDCRGQGARQGQVKHVQNTVKTLAAFGSIMGFQSRSYLPLASLTPTDQSVCLRLAALPPLPRSAPCRSQIQDFIGSENTALYVLHLGASRMSPVNSAGLKVN